MYRKMKGTTGERRAEAAERADEGRTPPTKGRRRHPPDPWDLEPVNERELRAFKVGRRLIAFAIKNGLTRQQAWEKLQAKGDFACLRREWFDLLWKWGREDAAERGKRK
jgi:hypothetical protein